MTKKAKTISWTIVIIIVAAIAAFVFCGNGKDAETAETTVDSVAAETVDTVAVADTLRLQSDTI